MSATNISSFEANKIKLYFFINLNANLISFRDRCFKLSYSVLGINIPIDMDNFAVFYLKETYLLGSSN